MLNDYWWAPEVRERAGGERGEVAAKIFLKSFLSSLFFSFSSFLFFLILTISVMVLSHVMVLVRVGILIFIIIVITVIILILISIRTPEAGMKSPITVKGGSKDLRWY